MKVQLPHSFKVMLLCLPLLYLLTGCVQNNTVQAISVVVDGKEINDSTAVMMDSGQLMASASFIKNTLGMSVDAASPVASTSTATYYSDQVAVLMYHDIVDKPEKPHMLPVQQFERQMELFKTNGFNVITMDDYVNFMTKGAAIPDNAILLTFDDGYESFYTHAFPILKKYNYTATNFVIVSFIDNREGRPKLTWDQMREMKKEGMSFYSHTYNSHKYGPIDAGGKTKPMLTRHLYLKDKQRVENDEEYIGRITGDLATAEKRLHQELGNTQGIIAFPYGAFNKDVIGVMNSLKIELSFTIKKGMTTRKDKNAFRFDAGNSKQSPEDLIKLLKEQGNGKDVGKNPSVPLNVTVDGKEVRFTKKLPSMKGNEVMIPLREFCNLYDIRIDWNNKKKKVTLSTSPAPNA
ncbi:polysaccharide deacetylase family protein [Paenibacillus profundus]|uniref:Polysaccharide deacetylase family protein n=1 Tax=Paenibacillus profundus TaxID=1173085 RepID=A0ABS8YJR8_9BACL|nr:polysaccharide deacetylase family protein [Paenibacillus profundus]MCE5170595.1 polysaccharide deacetylase family protein [Paenibacillus profundus]